MSRIVIADFNSFCFRGTCVGHSFGVAENYVQLFDGVVAAGAPVYGKRFPQAETLPYQPDERHGAFINKWMALLNLRVLFRRCREDILIMQSSAVATAFVGMALWRPRVKKLFMIQYNTEALNSPFKRLLYRLASPFIDGIICPTEDIGKAYGRPYCVVPDYICPPQQRSVSIPYAQKSYDFCMVGLICRDKGVVEAARALAGTPYRVLIAGCPNCPEIKTELLDIAASCSNIELKLQYLSEEEYAASIRAARYCILNYSGAYSEHSSGVVFDILFSGVPVVGRACESLRFIGESGTGALFTDISEMQPKALLQPEVYERYLEHIERYKASHRAHRERLARFLTAGEES